MRKAATRPTPTRGGWSLSGYGGAVGVPVLRQRLFRPYMDLPRIRRADALSLVHRRFGPNASRSLPRATAMVEGKRQLVARRIGAVGRGATRGMP